MITIKTANSRIVYSDGSNATGVLQIKPSEPFTFLDLDDLQRKRVTLETLQFPFLAGQLKDGPFKLAPTVNAQNSKSNLYYQVQYITASAMWTEYWTIDSNGENELEISDVTKIEPVPDILPSITPSDVTLLPAANMIPRADENGAIDLGWFPALPLNMLVYGYIGDRTSFIIPNGVFAAINDTTDGQIYLWDGAQFNAIGSGHTNAGLNSAVPVVLAAYIGNPLPTPAAGTLAFGVDYGEGQARFFTGADWSTISSAVHSPNALVGTSKKVPLVGVIAGTLPTISQQVLAVGYETDEEQKKIWDTIGWNVIS